MSMGVYGVWGISMGISMGVGVYGVWETGCGVWGVDMLLHVRC
jgi:hypothetical protein